MVYGPPRRHGSHATVPCWRPPRLSSAVQPPDILQKNCLRSSTLERKTPCVTFPAEEDCPGVNLRPVPLYGPRSSHSPATAPDTPQQPVGSHGYRCHPPGSVSR